MTQDGPVSESGIVARLDRAAQRFETPCGTGRMVWRRWGDGVPLVFLHGGAGSWQHWIRNIDAFAAHYQVWAPDTPGLGSSDLPPDPADVAGVAEIIGDGLTRLLGPAGRYHLIGFSYGGVVSALLAHRHQTRIRSLTLVGAGGMGGPRPPSGLVKVRDKVGEERVAAHRANLAALMIADPARIDALALEIQSWNSDHTRLNSRGFHAAGPVPRVLPEIPAPVTGIWGDLDASAGEYLAARREMLLRVRPDMAFRLIEGAGHWVAYEAAERFNSMLREVLENK